MNLPTIDSPGDDLHRPTRVIAPPSDRDTIALAALQRKQFGLPAMQALDGQRIGVMLRGIERDRDDPIGTRIFRA